MVTKSYRLDCTPYDVVLGRLASLARLRVFGCKTFVHRHEKNWHGKFDARADEGILVGYCKGSVHMVLLNDKRTVKETQDTKFRKRVRAAPKNVIEENLIELNLAYSDIIFDVQPAPDPVDGNTYDSGYESDDDTESPSEVGTSEESAHNVELDETQLRQVHTTQVWGKGSGTRQASPEIS